MNIKKKKIINSSQTSIYNYCGLTGFPIQFTSEYSLVSYKEKSNIHFAKWTVKTSSDGCILSSLSISSFDQSQSFLIIQGSLQNGLAWLVYFKQFLIYEAVILVIKWAFTMSMVLSMCMHPFCTQHSFRNCQSSQLRTWTNEKYSKISPD